MSDKKMSYAFPWGFHLGDLHRDNQSIPLYTPTQEGGFCLLYDKVSEAKCDALLESLTLELLSTMPHQSLKVDIFDFGKKKFYNLSPLQYVELYTTSYNPQMIENRFEAIEEIIVSRYQELLCCNRPSISEHNQKSKIKQNYHLVLINLEHFPPEEIALRRVENFVESAQKAGVYVVAFAPIAIKESQNKNIQTILNRFKILEVQKNDFNLTKEIFEFTELLEDHDFEPLSLDKALLMQEVLTNADLESFLDPEGIKLEEQTKV